MKHQRKMILLLLLLLALFVSGCGGGETEAEPNEDSLTQAAGGASSAQSEASAASSEAVATEETLTLGLDELAAYNGKDGNPAYIAVDGVIYDVTNAPKWQEGMHNGYAAGQDLTDEIMNVSPHGTAMLEGVPVVGSLVE